MQVGILIALSHCFFWPSPIDLQMNQQNVVIRGTVVDEATGRTVPGVPVYAWSLAYDAQAVSDSRGNFIFLTLFPGTYYLHATKSDGDDEIYGIDSSRDYVPPPELFAGFEYGATIFYSDRPH